MSGLRLVRYDSPAELRSVAGQWDDLWQRSDVTIPTARAELIAQWVEAFSPRARFSALAVEGEGRLLAALPLVGRKLTRLPWPSAATLTSNPWCPCGDLLVDPSAPPAVLDTLAGGLKSLPWPLIWCEEAPLETPRWQAWLAAVERLGMPVFRRVDYRVGQVDIPSNWNAFEASWSGNHRRHLRKTLKRMDREGTTRLVHHCAVDPLEVSSLLARAFEVEDKSWKGAQGTSVLRSPGILAFYERQARQLAAWGQLELSFLEHDGKAISASYGYRAKGVSFYHKVGYDAAYEGYSPGQALLYHLLRKQGVDGEPALLDFVGPLQEWTSKWATRTYALGRVVIAPRLAGRALLQAYTHAWPLVVQARQRLRREPIAARPRPDGEVSSAAEEKAAEPVPVENAST